MNDKELDRLKRERAIAWRKLREADERLRQALEATAPRTPTVYGTQL